jgi:hypothetical protein
MTIYHLATSVCISHTALNGLLKSNTEKLQAQTMVHECLRHRSPKAKQMCYPGWMHRDREGRQWGTHSLG